MMEWKTAFGVLATFITIYSYVPYYTGIFRGITRPHVLSWLAWSVMGGIVAATQLARGAGPGAWMAAASSILCFTVALAALKYGERKITRLDWGFFLSALAIIPVWTMTDDPQLAACLVTTASVLAHAPTIRKSWHAPFQENVAVFALTVAECLAAICAIGTYNLTTLIYPVSIGILNTLFVSLLLYRRQQLNKPSLVES